jgi:hypothetical protein
MPSRKHVCPSTLTEASRIPALRLCCVAHMLGLSYQTIAADVRAGELKVVTHHAKPGARPHYTVLQADFRRYLCHMTRRTILST